MKFLHSLCTTAALSAVSLPLIRAQDDLPSTVVDIALGSEDFETLVTAVSTAGLVETLQGDGPFTVFAPTNDAFAALGSDTIEKLLSEPFRAHLTDVLLYHVLSGEVLSTDLSLGLGAETLNGESINVTSMSPVTINDAEVVTADVRAENGVVHVLDTVLLPSSVTNTAVDVAVANPDFSTLVDLLVAADLVETLQGDGPFTIFAPTNDAFAKLAPAVLESVTDPANVDLLTSILTYHVTSGVILSDSLTDGASVTMLNGDDALVGLEPPSIADAEIIVTDILVSNGVIHVIDSVMLPPPAAEEDGEVEEVEMEEEETPSLSYVGNDGKFEVYPLGLCMGDCDHDDDCEDDLVCFQRDGEDPVPGCEGTDHSKTDYCVPPHDEEQLPHITYVGNNGEFDVYPLGLCMGDCDSDEDCEGDLVCFQRDREDPIPGCAGSDHSLSDYCVSPADAATIVDVAIATPDLSTLVDLVVLAELADTLASPGPFTVFAPVNSAFAALDAETVEFLTSEEGRDTLVDILTYHVLTGVVTSDMLEEGAEVTMVNGDVAVVSLTPDATIAGVNIIATDIETSNGVVHLLDGVMLPPS